MDSGTRLRLLTFLNLAKKLKAATRSLTEKRTAAYERQSTFENGAHAWTGLSTDTYC